MKCERVLIHCPFTQDEAGVREGVLIDCPFIPGVRRSYDGLSLYPRVRLECEREHQEHLLLSVMPAYIAAEVIRIPQKKTKSKDCCYNVKKLRRNYDDNSFHRNMKFYHYFLYLASMVFYNV